jgi:hypothetical protein
MDKREVIKAFLDGSDERFAIAHDLYEHFPAMVQSMLREIHEELFSDINATHHLDLGLLDIQVRNNDYAVWVNITDKYLLNIRYKFCFNEPTLRLTTHTGNVTPEDSHAQTLRQVLLQRIGNSSTENWTVMTVRPQQNMLGHMTTYADLYKIYKTAQLRQDVREAHHHILTPTIVEIVPLVLAHT